MLLTLGPEVSDPPPRAASKDVELEIVFRNGRRLIVSLAVDPDALARLLPCWRDDDRLPGGGARLDRRRGD